MLRLTTLCCALGLLMPLLACKQARQLMGEDPAPSALPPSPASGAASQPSTPDAGAWLSFSPPDGRCSVQLPKQPELDSQVTPTAAGPMRFSVYSAAGAFGWVYQLGFSDFPAHLVAQSQPAEMLSNAQRGAVSNVGGHVLSERELTVQGYPAREFSMSVTKEGMAVSYWGRMVLVGARLYQLQVIGLTAQAEHVQRERFFDSFKLSAK